MVAVVLLLAVAVGPQGPPLPGRLGAFVRGEVVIAEVNAEDRELFNEFGWEGGYRADYSDDQERQMTVEAFRFANAEGAHAAYLYSRPPDGISPMIWAIDAVTGGGVTVMEYRNYMLRFHGALPSVSSRMAEMLSGLPGLAADSAPWDISGRFLDRSSTRAILGPVSLRRFAMQVPPSVAGFELGAKGRVAQFETPAGAMTEVVFEYPTEAVAKDQAKALGELQGAAVNVDRTCAGVIFEPVDPVVAEELLSDYFCGPVVGHFDPNTAWDGPMTLFQGLGLVLWGFVVGAVIAGVRRLRRVSDPFPDRMIFLKL